MKSQLTRIPVVDRETGLEVGYREIATVTMDGHTFTASAGHVLPDHASAYISTDGLFLQQWDGHTLARLTRTALWQTPRSLDSPEMWQVEATIHGVRYTGRTSGPGFIWNGKRKATQPHNLQKPATP